MIRRRQAWVLVAAALAWPAAAHAAWTSQTSSASTLGTGSFPPKIELIPDFVYTSTAATTLLVGQSPTSNGGGTWTTWGAPTTYVRQFVICTTATTAACTPIGPSTTSTSAPIVFKPTATEVGKWLRVRVTATRTATGQTATTYSRPEQQITLEGPADTLASSVTITPNTGLSAGTVLTGDPSVWAFGLLPPLNLPLGSMASTYTYNWLRCDPVGEVCTTVATGTRAEGLLGTALKASYTVTAADAGSRLRFQVTRSSNTGVANTEESEATAIVGP